MSTPRIPSAAAGAQAVTTLLGLLRDLLLKFVLPIAGLGLALWGAEELLLAFGVHGDIAKLMRFAVLPIYGLVIFRATRSGGSGTGGTDGGGIDVV